MVTQVNQSKNGNHAVGAARLPFLSRQEHLEHDTNAMVPRLLYHVLSEDAIEIFAEHAKGGRGRLVLPRVINIIFMRGYFYGRLLCE